MEEKIKDLTLFIAVIGIAFLGYYYYQSSPQLNTNNNVVEQEVIEKGTEPIKTTTKTPASEGATTVSKDKLPTITGDGVYLVYYFDEGFFPNALQIRQGTSVRFINKSDNAMRVFTTNTSEYKFNQLNQTQSVGKEGTYDFTFLGSDVWTYFNQDTQSDHATILVY